MKQKDFYVEWLVAWFSGRVEMPSGAVHRNFFVEGWLDSFNTLELILEMETAFNISLNDSILSDPRFSSISGLSEILFEMQDGGSPPTR